jgi:hypothetical protein
VPPLVGVAVNVTDVPVQIVVAVAPIETDGTTTGLTVIVTEFDVTEVGEAQEAVDVITQVTTSPWDKVVLVYVVPVPTFPPFTFHWYAGVPPFTGVGVNVTDVPAQIVVAEALIVTDGVTVVFTVIVTLLDVAVVGEAQAAVEVITQVITLPFAKAAFV